ncbi:MAG TPA: radical SAM protein [Longimicrobiaceae bacterium]|jgi:uncharacterized protein
MATPSNLMELSPLDRPTTQHVPVLVQLTRSKPKPAGEGEVPVMSWVPSRFNARTTDDAGRLVVWNTKTGAMSLFDAGQKSMIERLLRRSGFSAKPTGIVKYLRDRGYVVPRGTDELRGLQLAFGEQHYRNDLMELILLASEDCNFRCVYCYEDFPRGTMLPEVREGVKNLVRRRAPQLRALSISWFGGEPLYGFAAIEDLAPFFVEIAEQHSLVYMTHMTTNGYLLTPEVAAKLLAWNIRDFQITLDGGPEDHNRTRHGRDGSETFGRILDNLCALRARDDEFSVTIRVNFDHVNHPRLESFLDVIQQEFAGDRRFHISFHAVGQWGGANDDALDTCGADESRLVREQLRRAARDRGINLDHTLKEIGSLGKQVCYAARPYNLVVGADGKLMKCTVALDKKDHNIVGRITPEGETVLDPDKMALWVEPAFANDSGCRRCHLVPVCQGISCPLVRIEDGHRPCIPARSNLRNELLAAMEASEPSARNVRVGPEVPAAGPVVQ